MPGGLDGFTLARLARVFDQAEFYASPNSFISAVIRVCSSLRKAAN
jgi:hypothetical protein